MFISLVALFFTLFLHANADVNDEPILRIGDAKQLVIVIGADENSTTAQLFRFEKHRKKWTQTGEVHPASLGYKGLAWGQGLHAPQPGYQKKEGDGKSPAGIFRFGTAFGYANPGQVSFNMDYLQLTPEQICVEDSSSRFYNQIIDETKVKKDWNSNEAMRREDWLYKWGLLVEHNTPAQAGGGSCIFFHLWREEGSPTLGCTAMSEENLLSLLQWLNHKKKPLLVQLTANDYAAFQQKYSLPLLP